MNIVWGILVNIMCHYKICVRVIEINEWMLCSNDGDNNNSHLMDKSVSLFLPSINRFQ